MSGTTLDAHPLPVALQMAVALESLAFQCLDDDAFARQIEMMPDATGTAAQLIAEHGDELLFGGKHCPTTFAALVRAVTLASVTTPGGVTFAGMHFTCRRGGASRGQ